MTLPQHAVVNDRFTIVRTARTPALFSRTYLARDEREGEEVLLIEYFPADLAWREAGELEVRVPEGPPTRHFEDGLVAFLEEHVRLRGIDHPGLVRERLAFEAHGTAYRVQTHEEGASLEHVLRRRGALPLEAAQAVLLPLLDGLEALHDVGMMHGGVAPSAVWLTQTGRSYLLHVRHADLRLAADLGSDGGSAETFVPGFAPPEAYLMGAAMGPAADVYGVAALLVRMLSGRDLPSVDERMESDEMAQIVRQLDVEPALQDALLQALQLDGEARCSVDELRRLLEPLGAADGESEGRAAVEPEENVDEEPDVEDEPEPLVEDAVDPQDEAEPAPEPTQPNEPTPAAPEAALQDATPADRRAARRASRERGQQRRKALVLAVVVAIVALAGVTYSSTLFVRGEADEPSPEVTQAAFFVAEGDTLLQAGQFEGARQLYERALKVDPGNEVATARLEDVERGLASRERGAFLRLVQRGDSLMTAGRARADVDETDAARRLFTSATSHFLRALDLQPDDSLVIARLERAAQYSRGSVEPDTAAAPRPVPSPETPRVDVTAVRAHMFDLLQEEGEARLSDGDTVGAERKFTEALDLRQDSALLARRDALRRVLGERQEREAYRSAMERGRRLLAQERYAEARLAFGEALDVVPRDRRAVEQIAAIDERVQGEERRMRQFEYLRAQGDVLLDQGDVEAAIDKYREAQAHAATDTALQGQIDALVRRQEADARRRDGEGVYTVTDVAPQLIGSQADLHRQARYPELAVRAGVEGRVYVQLVIDEEGRVTQADVVRGIGAGCDEEAVRILKEARFEPGTIGGRPVKARQTMFIEFRLEHARK